MKILAIMSKFDTIVIQVIFRAIEYFNFLEIVQFVDLIVKKYLPKFIPLFKQFNKIK